MGRKIPGKKHRTVKHPAKQQQARLDSVKNKINDPPRNSEVQEIPRSLLNLMALKNKVKTKHQSSESGKKNRRRKKKNSLMCVAKVLDKYPNVKSTGYIPNLIQKPGETPQSFLRRMNKMTQGLIEEVEYEKKFGVQIKKNEETGEVIEVRKIKRKKKSKKKTLAEKRKEKKSQRKENTSNFKDFNQFKDCVKFGEVVERPPTLPKIKDSIKVEKTIKSKYGDLLLNKVVGNKSLDKTTVSLFEKEKAENERKFIVEAYRKAKSKR